MKPADWTRVQEIFHRALDHPSSERQRFVETACAGDPHIATHVLSMLEAHFADPDFMERPIGAWPEGIDTEASPDEDWAPGQQRIGPFEIVRPLGEGGMGIVFLARQETPEFTRSVAIKVVRRGMDTDDVLRRFDIERQILASLNHPNIAQLHDAGATEDGRPYFVMEFVDGMRLDRWIEERRPDLSTRLRLFQQICSAVQYAHQNLVVHRDLKPGNVLVTEDGTVKLVDFGIGRILSDSSDPSGSVTRTQARVLTPDYAAPEQFTGATLTTAADIYSLGVLLYEMLTGCRPWSEGRTTDPATGAPSPSTTARRPSQVVATRSELSSSERARLSRALRGDLDNIVAMAMRPEPDRRYSSVSALSDDLDRNRAGRTVRARPDSLAYRASTFARRNPWLLATAAITVIALTGVATTSAVQSRRTARERDKAREVQSFLLETFGASTAEGAAGDSVSVRQLLDSQRDIVSTLYSEDPELEAEMWTVLAEAYDRLGLYDDAAALADASLTSRRAIYDGDHPDVAHVLNLAGWIAHQRGASEEGATMLGESIAMWRRLGDGEQTGLARALNDLGSILDQLGRPDEAEPLLREALALRRTGNESLDRGVAVTSSNLAVLLYRRGDYTGADSLGQVALDALRATVGPDHQRTFIAQGNLATFRWVAGDLDGAAALHQDLLERTTRLRGDRNPRTASAMVTYASLLRAQGRSEDAEQMLRDALAIQDATLDPDHRDIGNTARILGIVLQQSGRASEGLPYLERAVRVNRAAYGVDHPQVGEAVLGVGISAEQLGRTGQALQAYEESARILLGAYGDEHPRTRDAMERLEALRERTRS